MTREPKAPIGADTGAINTFWLFPFGRDSHVRLATGFHNIETTSGTGTSRSHSTPARAPIHLARRAFVLAAKWGELG